MKHEVWKILSFELFPTHTWIRPIKILFKAEDTEIDTTKTSTTGSSSSNHSQKVTSENQTLSKAERNKENGREIDGIIDRWNKMSSKSSGAKSMTSSITIPMSNSGQESTDRTRRSFVHATAYILVMMQPWKFAYLWFRWFIGDFIKWLVSFVRQFWWRNRSRYYICNQGW